MNFISRERVLLALDKIGAEKGNWEAAADLIRGLPSFPAPNPEMKDGRNIMGQTEDQFWALVEAQEK